MIEHPQKASPSQAVGAVERQRKFSALNKIEQALKSRSHGLMPPRTGLATIATIATFVVAMAGMAWSGPTPINPWLLNLVPIAAGGVVFHLVRSRSTLSQSWSSVLDERLAEYAPQNRDAYIALQNSTRDRGYLDTNDLFEWLGAERRAIDLVSGLRQPAQRSKFLDNEV